MPFYDREDKILDILMREGTVTPEHLAAMLYVSLPTVRRDLIRLDKKGLILRSHGSVAIKRTAADAKIPFSLREDERSTQKDIMARRAAELVSDGDTVMLDGSTTAGYLIPYIAKHKDMTVFTNNMLTAISAINYGIPTHCIGGRSVNQSAVLSGGEAYRTAARLYPDVLFFSSKSLDKDGVIYDPIPEETHIREIMLQNATVRVFLCDSDKFGSRSLYKLTSLDEIDAAVFDKPIVGLHAKCKILY